MNVTQTAQKRIDDILTFDYVFRIEIQGGGCTGFKYNFDITDVEEDDIHIAVSYTHLTLPTKA